MSLMSLLDLSDLKSKNLIIVFKNVTHQPVTLLPKPIFTHIYCLLNVNFGPWIFSINRTTNEFVMKVTEILWFPPVLLNSGTPAAKQSYQSANYSTFSSCRIPLKKKNHAFLLSWTLCTWGESSRIVIVLATSIVQYRREGADKTLFNYERSLRHCQAVEWKSEDELTHSLNVIDYVTSPCSSVLSSLFLCWWDLLTFRSPAS